MPRLLMMIILINIINYDASHGSHPTYVSPVARARVGPVPPMTRDGVECVQREEQAGVLTQASVKRSDKRVL